MFFRSVIKDGTIERLHIRRLWNYIEMKTRTPNERGHKRGVGREALSIRAGGIGTLLSSSSKEREKVVLEYSVRVN